MSLRAVVLLAFLADQASKALMTHVLRLGQSWPVFGN